MPDDPLSTNGNYLIPPYTPTPSNPGPTMPPIVPSQQPDAPNLGTAGSDQPQQSQIGPAGGQQQQTGPPKQSVVPALAGFLQQMIKGPGYEQGANGQPGRPISRLDAFENFLGNFLQSFATGMSNAGTGPAANARGFGAAVQAPYQRELQQYQLGQQQQQAQAQAAEAQGRAAESQARATQMGQMVTLPNGMTMPIALAEKVYPAMISGQARVAAAQAQKRYLPSGFGILDTTTGKYVGGAMMGTTMVTPDMAQEYNMPQEWVGKQQKTSDVSGWMKAQAAQYTMVQGSQGASREQKVGPVGNLGLGSPAANPIAQANLQLRQASFQRDTFGQFFGNIAQRYPGLQAFIDDNGNTMGWKSPITPTSAIRTKAATAKGVLPVFDEAMAQVDAADKAGLLGPAAGRLNTWWVSGVGGDDPQMASVRTIVSLAKSGALNAHFGARGASKVLDHFTSLVDTGKMTGDDLKASLKAMRGVMQGYANEAPTNVKPGGGTNQNNPTATGQIQFTPVKP